METGDSDPDHNTTDVCVTTQKRYRKIYETWPVRKRNFHTGHVSCCFSDNWMVMFDGMKI